MDAEQGTVADWFEQRKQRLVWLLPSTGGSGSRVNGSSSTLHGPRMAPPSGGLACRPGGDRLAQWRDGVGLPQCGFSVLLSSGFSFSPSSSPSCGG
jgi:hypothetical protein